MCLSLTPPHTVPLFLKPHYLWGGEAKAWPRAPQHPEALQESHNTCCAWCSWSGQRLAWAGECPAAQPGEANLPLYAKVPADVCPLASTDRWMRPCPLQQVSGWTLGVKRSTCLAHSLREAPSQCPHCSAVSCFSPSMLSPPPSPLYSGVQLLVLPPFMVLLPSHCLVEANPHKTLHQRLFSLSSHATLQPVYLPVSHLRSLPHSQHVPDVLQIRGAEPSLSLGLHARLPSPTSLPYGSLPHCSLVVEGNQYPQQSTPVLEDTAHPRPSSKSGYHSPAAPGHGAERAGEWW